MKFTVLETIKLKTSKGNMELKPGQMVLLPHNVATQLLRQGKIKQIRKQYKIYSKVLNDFLWVVATEQELREMLDEDPEMVVYTFKEISKLDENISKDVLRKIHSVKKIFPGSTIENIGDNRL
ncbi:MAG: hypothetical protein SCARUB_01191 [Candidatus Scalindua rubra]|uniref:Uncharacterized protein n=1 Tax=Candidatus Scalindua rubra TaxID=1872076 RepID=A0A1E3XDF6_9BACT|nr:MAG: hypothetical protein SCARUB_01191 [Candidatus Scalindua rubra]